jgi:hypothetical protein
MVAEMDRDIVMDRRCDGRVGWPIGHTIDKFIFLRRARSF